MKYLITGGAGFIGSHLVDRLLGQGHEVNVVDNLSTGSISNLVHHSENPKFCFSEGSVLDNFLISELVEKSDRVFHFAAVVGVFNILENPIQSIKTNIGGTETVLDACLRFGKPVLIASSSEVYGKNDIDKLTENSDRIIGVPQKIRWSYSDSKSIDEAYAFSLHDQRGLETRVVRLFNTVGPRQVGSYGMVVPRFVEAALSGKPLFVYGNGNQTRCFGHVLDIVDAILRVDKCASAVGLPINIGVDKETSILDLANLIIGQLKSKSKIELKAYRESYSVGYEDMLRRVPDTSLLENLTGWSPQYSLSQIISDLANHMMGLDASYER